MFKKIFFLISVLVSSAVFAQDDLLSLVDSVEKPVKKEFTTATFKGTRIINLHTIEVGGPHTLDFRISHRFGELNSGAYNAFGLDGSANIRLGLEYCFDGRLQLGLGRSSYEKLIDGFVKYRLIRQTEDNKIPISVTLFSGMNYTAIKDLNVSTTGIDKYGFLSSRFSYVHQIIIASKINRNLSLELLPIYVHYNMVEKIKDKNDMYGIAFGGRYKMTKRFALTIEYIFRLNKYSDSFSTFYNSFGLGFDLETGGHVFQVHFTNSFGVDEVQNVPYTSGSWFKGGIRLGFNISRVFAIGVRH